MNPASQKYLDLYTIWICGSCIGLLAGDVVIGSYNAGISPLKPSVFTWAVFLMCLVPCLLSRPRFCLGGFWVLTLPLVRLLDISILERFAYSEGKAEMMSCLRIFLVAVSMMGILSTASGLRAMRWAAIVAVLVTSGSVVAEFMGLANFTSIEGRFSGFNGHPNSPPIIICQSLGVIFALSRNFRLNVAMIAIGIPGVALTYGRSGFAVLAVLCGAYILLNARRNLGFLVVCACILIPLAGTGLAIMQTRTEEGIIKNKDTEGRLQAIYELDFEKLKSPERAKDLMDAWEGVLQKPILGYGVGVASSRWFPHNEYVAMWLELGIGGLGLYIAIMWGLALKSLMCRGLAGYAIFAMLAFSPTAQARVMDPHFYLALITTAHVLWPRRYQLTLRSLKPQTVNIQQKAIGQV